MTITEAMITPRSFGACALWSVNHRNFCFWTTGQPISIGDLWEFLRNSLLPIPDDSDDRALINAITNGDRNAIGTLYSRHHKRVFLFIKRFVNNDEVAEDIANDVFIEVWQKASSYEGRSKVSSWLLGMARYKALSEVRKKRPTSASDEVMESIVDDADTPEVTAQKISKGNLLKQCINKLSGEHRTIIDLIYYHEKSIKEISMILEVPENTVKTRAFHARKLLSAAMERAGIDRGWP